MGLGTGQGAWRGYGAWYGTRGMVGVWGLVQDRGHDTYGLLTTALYVKSVSLERLQEYRQWIL